MAGALEQIAPPEKMAESEQKKEHYLLSNRDEAEVNRLKFQHHVVTQVCGGNVLDPKIPKLNIKTIADVATGTGIWLEDVAAELTAAGNHNFELTGFDICKANFTKDPKAKIDFVLHDINHGFDERYHGKFDVVHISYLVVVLQVDQIPQAVRNVVKLLKPGGYLTWLDLDFEDSPGSQFIESGTEPLHDMGKTVLEFCRTQKWSLNILAEVAKALAALPMKKVHVSAIRGQCYSSANVQSLVVELYRQNIGAVWYMAWLRMGKSQEEAQQLVIEYQMRLDQLAAKGVMFSKALKTILAQKASSDSLSASL